MNNQKLLKVRSLIKKRKPLYKRVQKNQFAKFREDKWRRPKGKGNKDRRNRKGHVGMLKIGYGSPKEVKYLNRFGLKEIIVKNILEIEKIDFKSQIPIISRTLGGKKKLELLKYAKQKKLNFGNISNIEKSIIKLTPKKREKKKFKPQTTDNKNNKTKDTNVKKVEKIESKKIDTTKEVKVIDKIKDTNVEKVEKVEKKTKENSSTLENKK